MTNDVLNYQNKLPSRALIYLWFTGLPSLGRMEENTLSLASRLLLGWSQTLLSGSLPLHWPEVLGVDHPPNPFPQASWFPTWNFPRTWRGSYLFPEQTFLATDSFLLTTLPPQGGPKASQTGLVKFSPSPSCILYSSLFSHVITIHTCYSLRVSSFSTRPHRSHRLNPLNGSEICSVFSSYICYHFLATLMLPRPPHKCFPKCGTDPTGGHPIWS